MLAAILLALSFINALYRRSTSATVVLEYLACVANQLLLQLEYLGLSNNQLVGSLPGTWSQLTSVSYVNGANRNLMMLVHAVAVLAQFT